MTTTTFKKAFSKQGTERMRSFLFDNFTGKKETNTKETINMNNNLFTKAIDGVKAGWTKFSNHEKVTKAVEVTAEYTGKAYRFVKKVVKAHWKNATLATAATVAAGAMTTGAVGAVTAGSLIYAGIKTLAYAIRKNKTVSLGESGMEWLVQFTAGLLWAVGVSAFVWFAAPYILIDLANLFNTLYAGWVYSLFFIFA